MNEDKLGMVNMSNVIDLFFFCFDHEVFWGVPQLWDGFDHEVSWEGPQLWEAPLSPYHNPY